jgi:hypothetical protein
MSKGDSSSEGTPSCKTQRRRATCIPSTAVEISHPTRVSQQNPLPTRRQHMMNQLGRSQANRRWKERGRLSHRVGQVLGTMLSFLKGGSPMPSLQGVLQVSSLPC